MEERGRQEGEWINIVDDTNEQWTDEFCKSKGIGKKDSYVPSKISWVVSYNNNKLRLETEKCSPVNYYVPSKANRYYNKTNRFS